MQLDPYRAYQEAQVKTREKGRLVLILYEEAIRYLKEAAKALREGDAERKGERLIYGMEVISELLSSLDSSQGEIATNLRSLYTFMLQRLLLADAEGDAEKIDEVTGLLEDLREGWREVLEGKGKRR
ncbi:MAG: flagellar export chaperone FliS [Deltaproteobacteria bacterium]|nr:MAG: flagellar export chaperone FliS [Deltaproteobacteria bacterium]RLA98467.1 MAG: flagellar export chaperone FliS [Deltaproteobacteria bacterium]